MCGLTVGRLPPPDSPPVLAALAEAGSEDPTILHPLEIAEAFRHALAAGRAATLDRSSAFVGFAQAAALAAGEAFVRGLSHHPWNAGFDLTRQLWAARTAFETPNAGYRPLTSFRSSTTLFALWNGFETRTCVAGGEWPLGDDDRTPRGSCLWKLAFRADTRVFELRLPSDWASLVERYPLCVGDSGHPVAPGVSVRGPVYIPDWARACRDWDGIRLPLEGLARIVLTEIPVLDGFTALVLTDSWHERTAWLNWKVQAARVCGYR